MNSKHTQFEIERPDISRHRDGNCGIPYLYSYQAAQPGPHVMLCALTHGNEYCGAIVIDRLLQMGLRPTRGKLSFCFANVAAFDRFDPSMPFASRCVDEDFNRIWSADRLQCERINSELERARALQPVVDTVDFLLDIHSIDAPHPPLMLTGMQARSTWLAKKMGIPFVLVRDRGHGDGVRLRDYAEFDAPESERTALLVECGQHWRQQSLQTAWWSAWRFLQVLDVVDAQLSKLILGGCRCEATTVLEITDAVVCNSSDVSFSAGLSGLSMVPRRGTTIGWNGSEKIVTPYDNCRLVMPRLSHAKPGITAVRFGREVQFHA